jgi:hypothetical protein
MNALRNLGNFLIRRGKNKGQADPVRRHRSELSKNLGPKRRNPEMHWIRHSQSCTRDARAPREMVYLSNFFEKIKKKLDIDFRAQIPLSCS